MRKKILFQGSHVANGRSRNDRPEQLELAQAIAIPLAKELVVAGFDLMIAGGTALEQSYGKSAAAACKELGVDVRERVRTFLLAVATRTPVDTEWCSGPQDGITKTFARS